MAGGSGARQYIRAFKRDTRPVCSCRESPLDLFCPRSRRASTGITLPNAALVNRRDPCLKPLPRTLPRESTQHARVSPRGAGSGGEAAPSKEIADGVLTSISRFTAEE